MIWNSEASDYGSGVKIYDPKTGKHYTEEQARELPAEVRRRLCVKARYSGVFVKDGRNPSGRVHKRFGGRTNVACSRPLVNGLRAEDGWEGVTCKQCLGRKSVCDLIENMRGGEK